MRLVGASNFTIQLPFLLEAAVAAAIGSAVAVGALVASKIFLIDQTLAKTFTFTTFIGWEAIYSVIPIMLGAGVGLAVLAAGTTLRKYLKV
jgi:cell division transport system permease protein